MPLDFLPVSEKSESATLAAATPGARLAAIGRGVERPWRRSHGANLNPATAVFPVVAVLAKRLHVSVRFTATIAAMEAAIVFWACGRDTPASRPQDAVRQRRSLGSGNQALKGTEGEELRTALRQRVTHMPPDGRRRIRRFVRRVPRRARRTPEVEAGRSLPQFPRACSTRERNNGHIRHDTRESRDAAPARPWVREPRRPVPSDSGGAVTLKRLEKNSLEIAAGT